MTGTLGNGAQFIEHVTMDGDRWDLLAWRYYGNALDYERIIVANPELPITPRLAGGITVRIPVIADAPAATAGLPPWKRTR